jgi:CheY-like chemotaxis protein
VILNVDDDPDDREIFIEAVKEVNASIKCLTAEDGIQAQRLLADRLIVQRLRCIFIDINMPLMNGLSLLALIKTDHVLSKIPVYIYTTSENPHEIEKIESLGGQYIKKHADFDGLVQTLTRILKNQNLN